MGRGRSILSRPSLSPYGGAPVTNIPNLDSRIGGDGWAGPTFVWHRRPRFARTRHRREEQPYRATAASCALVPVSAAAPDRRFP
jgi:hypothetical protein